MGLFYDCQQKAYSIQTVTQTVIHVRITPFQITFWFQSGCTFAKWLRAVYEESGRATQLTSLNKKNMENEQTIDALNKLVQINNERVEGYQTAKKETEEDDLKKMFVLFAQTSEKNTA